MKRAVIGAALAALLVVPAMASAQTAPLKANIFFFQNPPADLTFATGAPIVVALQVRNVSGGPLTTADGFSVELWRQLFLIDPRGGLLANRDAALAHRHAHVTHCHSRQGVTQRPTALSLFPAEVVPTAFAQQYVIDLRRFFDLQQPGRWRAQLRIPFVRFNVDAATLVTDCDQLEGTAVNVGTNPGDSHAATSIKRDPFMILSNYLEFVIARFRFVGFSSPIVNDTDPTCQRLPCRTYKANSTLPVRFQLLDQTNNNAVVSNATPRIAVEWVSGTIPPVIPDDLGTSAADIGDRFRFDGSQYTFNLKLALTPGTYKVKAILDDGVVHSVTIGVH